MYKFQTCSILKVTNLWRFLNIVITFLLCVLLYLRLFYVYIGYLSGVSYNNIVTLGCPHREAQVSSRSKYLIELILWNVKFTTFILFNNIMRELQLKPS